MAVLKCKMCGGDLEVSPQMTFGTCEYCGTTMTIPKDTDERRANLFNRANQLRANNDFDNAALAYENILAENINDAEAHWGICLCRYGIEYVQDPKTQKRIPTCHRTQFKSILDDEDYKQALENADVIAKGIYIQEAQYIDEIQKGILEISQKEEPFDVFICYKETDENGERTHDSVLAQDIYYALTKEGYKVFFAKITLENKLGEAYEPYIFAALNSAKAMIVLGTKPEYFNAVWVKNEWSRYLALISDGQQKLLIPAYRDMDPYDLPKEFANIQALDMGKIGFIQDLIHGIKKIISNKNEDSVQTQNIVQNVTVSNINVDNLVKRAKIAVDENDFEKAHEFIERILDEDAENAEAYIIQLMCNLKLNNESQLSKVIEPLNRYKEFNRAYNFANNEYKEKLQNYLINSTNNFCDNIVKELRAIKSETELEKLIKEIEALPECSQKNVTCAKAKDLLKRTKSLVNNKMNEVQNYSKQLDNLVMNARTTINGYMDKLDSIFITMVAVIVIVAGIIGIAFWISSGSFVGGFLGGTFCAVGFAALVGTICYKAYGSIKETYNGKTQICFESFCNSVKEGLKNTTYGEKLSMALYSRAGTPIMLSNDELLFVLEKRNNSKSMMVLRKNNTLEKNKFLENADFVNEILPVTNDVAASISEDSAVRFIFGMDDIDTDSTNLIYIDVEKLELFANSQLFNETYSKLSI